MSDDVIRIQFGYKEFDREHNVLETGASLVSNELRFFIKKLLVNIVGNDVDLIAYRIMDPRDKFGEIDCLTHSLIINLCHHFDYLTKNNYIKNDGNNNLRNIFSMKFLLLKALLYTVAYNGYIYNNKKKILEHKMDDKQLSLYADDHSWKIVNEYDVKIERFGRCLDSPISEYIYSLKNGINSSDIFRKAPPGWKTHQIYMHEHNLASYDPNGKTYLNFKEAFENGRKRARAEHAEFWKEEEAAFEEAVNKDYEEYDRECLTPPGYMDDCPDDMDPWEWELHYTGG